MGHSQDPDLGCLTQDILNFGVLILSVNFCTPKMQVALRVWSSKFDSLWGTRVLRAVKLWRPNSKCNLHFGCAEIRAENQKREITNILSQTCQDNPCTGVIHSYMKTYASGCARCKTQDGFSLRFCIDFPIETAWLFLGQLSSTSKSSSSSSFWS